MKIIKRIKESFDNPNLSEDISSDDLYRDIVEYVKEDIEYTLDNIVMKIYQDLDNYNPDWAREDINSKTEDAITRVAESVAEDLLMYAPDTIEESCGKKGKKILQEKKWRHQLSIGGRLRQAIEDADYDLIKELLIAAYKEIHEVDPENFDEHDLDRAIDDVEILDTEPDEDIDEYEIEGNFDYELNNLYDLCDGLDIWIPLTESLNEADLNPNVRKEITKAYKVYGKKQDPDRKANGELKRTIRGRAIKDIPDKEKRKKFIKDADEIIDDVYPTKSKTKFVPPSRGDKVETRDYPFYVTYYSEYPIYEPAEGGYYYAGANARYSKGFQTREEAQAHLRELAEEEDMDIVNDDYAQINTKYIGEQDHIVVETRKSYLSGEKGYVPYS